LLIQIWGFNFSLDPLLTEAVDDPWQVFTKHLAQLLLDLALDKFLDDSN